MGRVFIIGIGHSSATEALVICSFASDYEASKGSDCGKVKLRVPTLSPKRKQDKLFDFDGSRIYLRAMVDDHGDVELIEALRRREQDALAAAYDRYGQIVYSLFLRIVRDESVAEDLVQELFLRVWNRSKDFDATKGSLSVWVLSIARHMAIDHIRSAHARFSTRLRPLEDAERVRSTARQSEPETSIDQVRTVHAAFSYLTFNQKRVMQLAYFEGFSQSEIAARLNEPLGTVKSWMRSALLRLRGAIPGKEVQ